MRSVERRLRSARADRGRAAAPRRTGRCADAGGTRRRRKNCEMPRERCSSTRGPSRRACIEVALVTGWRVRWRKRARGIGRGDAAEILVATGVLGRLLYADPRRDAREQMVVDVLATPAAARREPAAREADRLVRLAAVIGLGDRTQEAGEALFSDGPAPAGRVDEDIRERRAPEQRKLGERAGARMHAEHRVDDGRVRAGRSEHEQRREPERIALGRGRNLRRRSREGRGRRGRRRRGCRGRGRRIGRGGAGALGRLTRAQSSRAQGAGPPAAPVPWAASDMNYAPRRDVSQVGAPRRLRL